MKLYRTAPGFRAALIFASALGSMPTFAQQTAKDCKANQFLHPMGGGMCHTIPACPETQFDDRSKPPCLQSVPDANGDVPKSKRHFLHVHANQFFNLRSSSGYPAAEASRVFGSRMLGTAAPDSTGMAMVDYRFDANPRHQLGVSFMGSTEPYTLGNPLGVAQPFQVGDNRRDGSPFLDYQHEHKAIMGLSFSDRLAIDAARGRYLTLSWSPIGEVKGPTYAGHRASAYRNPFIPNSHHLQDSTHVTGNIAQAVFTTPTSSVSYSRFAGTERPPGAPKIAFDPMDSYAVSATHQFCGNITVGAMFAQVTHAHAGVNEVVNAVSNGVPSGDHHHDGEGHHEPVAGPEAPEHETKFVAWVESRHSIKNHPFFQTTMYGQAYNREEATMRRSLLHEGTVLYRGNRDSVYYRVEGYDRKNGELGPGRPNAMPWSFQIGADREIAKRGDLRMYLGADYIRYAMPESWKPAYQGRTPQTIGAHIRVEWMKNKRF